MPFDRSRYPADWPAISRRIREREGNRCKQCGVENGSVGARARDGVWYPADLIHGMNCDVGEVLFRDGFPRMIRIVLTVAHHPDADPMNCADENLSALCQRCHLALDRAHHVAKAAETRRQKRAAIQPELLPVA